MHGVYLCVYWPVIMSNLSSSLRIWIWKTEVRPGTWVREFLITFRAYRPSSEPTITIWKEKCTKWRDRQFWHLHSALSNYTASFAERTNQMSDMHSILFLKILFYKMFTKYQVRSVNIHGSVQYEQIVEYSWNTWSVSGKVQLISSRSSPSSFNNEFPNSFWIWHRKGDEDKNGALMYPITLVGNYNVRRKHPAFPPHTHTQSSNMTTGALAYKPARLKH